QVQPRPLAVHELIEVTGQALFEVVVLGPGADRLLDGGVAVLSERHRPPLPAVPLRAVVPALHRSHLARAGITGDRLPVRSLPFLAARVRARAGGLPVSGPERAQDARPH